MKSEDKNERLKTIRLDDFFEVLTIGCFLLGSILILAGILCIYWYGEFYPFAFIYGTLLLGCAFIVARAEKYIEKKLKARER